MNIFFFAQAQACEGGNKCKVRQEGGSVKESGELRARPKPSDRERERERDFKKKTPIFKNYRLSLEMGKKSISMRQNN